MAENKTALLWALGLLVGALLASVILIMLWRRAKTSILWRFIFCFYIAAIVTPVGFNNGHSAGWFLPAFFTLGGLFSGQHEEFFFALKIIGVAILPCALVLFGIWSMILFVKNERTKRKQNQDDEKKT